MERLFGLSNWMLVNVISEAERACITFIRLLQLNNIAIISIAR